MLDANPVGLLDQPTEVATPDLASIGHISHESAISANRLINPSDEHAGTDPDEFGRMFGCANHAVLQIEADGRLVRANRRGERALELGRMLQLDNGRVLPTRKSYVTDWRRSLLTAGNGEPGLAFIGDGRVEIAVAIGKSGDRIRSPGNVPTLLVIMAADSACDDRAFAQYASNHQLTPAEQRVLGKLLEGLAPCEIAYEYEIAENTVRSQIKNVLAKTGNHSIRNLLLSVSRLPPVSFLENHDETTTTPEAKA